MTFVVKIRGDASAPIVADFRCAECGVFEAVVPRAQSDNAECPTCGEIAPWTPSVVCGKVKRFEVSRGGWEKPENPGWLDTRDLGEGMDHGEWMEKRQAIRDRQREAEIKGLVDGR